MAKTGAAERSSSRVNPALTLAPPADRRAARIIRPDGLRRLAPALAQTANGEAVLSNNRNTAGRPDLNKAAWQTLRPAVRQRDGNRCGHCGTTGEWARLSVHHLVPARLGGTDTVPARLGGTDTMDNLITLCHICHPQYERAARTPT
jgi:HNH endonuclease